jgi:hypothetical protein
MNAATLALVRLVFSSALAMVSPLEWLIKIIRQYDDSGQMHDHRILTKDFVVSKFSKGPMAVVLPLR